MKNKFGSLFYITSKDFQIVQVRGTEYAMRSMNDKVYKSQNGGIRWREVEDTFSWLCFNSELTGREISEKQLQSMHDQRYTFQCLQADDTFYRSAMLPSTKGEAAAAMAEYRKVFTKCTAWKVVEVQIK